MSQLQDWAGHLARYPAQCQRQHWAWQRARYKARSRARRRGTVLYFVAGSILVILGFAALAVDLSVLTNDKNQLQRVCDAAALGGSTQLPDTVGATRVARVVAQQNRYDINANNTISITFLEDNTKIRVETVRTRSLFFARVLGLATGVVRAHAIAGLSKGTPSIAPIGITDTTYDGQNPIVSGTRRLYDTANSPTYTIKLIDHKKEAFNVDEFVLFDLRDANAKSPAHMERQLAGTEPVNITASDVVNAVDPPDATALNAKSQDDFLFDGMGERFQAAAGSPWLDIDPNQGTNYVNYVGQHFTSIVQNTEPVGNGNPFFQNPRVLSLIVTYETSSNTNGTLNAPVVALAPVYVVRIYRQSGATYLDYRYMPQNLSGSGQGVLVE